MIFHIFFFDGPERSESHMKRHKRDARPGFSDVLQQLLREMQARCGCCGGAFFPCIYRLVPFGILQLLFNLGRQRHYANFVDDLFKNPVKREAYITISAFCNAKDLRS